VTLLLLLTSSGGPRPVVAAIPATSDLTATADDRAAVSPVAEINVFAGGAANAESRAADQAAAIIAATADLSALLRNATDRAAEQIIAISDVDAVLRSTTVRLTGSADATASGSAVLKTLVVYSVAAIIEAHSEAYARVPPRTIGAVATSAPGRATGGALSGGGRGATGTADPGAGRSSAGSLTGSARGTSGTATPASGR
jgi:hypothetical protein